jgi:hypothetical protein
MRGALALVYEAPYQQLCFFKGGIIMSALPTVSMIVPRILLLLVVLGSLVILFVFALKKGVRGTKIMLMGLSLILFGAFLASGFGRGWAGHIILLSGLVFSVTGLFRKE